MQSWLLKNRDPNHSWKDTAPMRCPCVLTDCTSARGCPWWMDPECLSLHSFTLKQSFVSIHSQGEALVSCDVAFSCLKRCWLLVLEGSKAGQLSLVLFCWQLREEWQLPLACMAIPEACYLSVINYSFKSIEHTFHIITLFLKYSPSIHLATIMSPDKLQALCRHLRDIPYT